MSAQLHSKNTPRFVVFRADADPQMGGGHIMRCLTLAKAFSDWGWECCFATTSGSGRTVPALDRAGFRVIEVDGIPDQGAATLRMMLPGMPDLLVIDHPHYAAEEEIAFRGVAARRLVIDGRYRNHDAEIWLDPNPGHEIERLRPLATRECKIFCGGAYLPIDPGVLAKRADSLRRREQSRFAIKRILVGFGASDQGSVIEQVLQGIAAFALDRAVTVLAGAAASRCRETVARLGLTANTLIWSDDMGGLMADADLMIGAGGISAWERCAIGLPSLLITVAPDQIATAAYLVDQGAAMALGAGEDVRMAGVAEALRSLDQTPERVEAMSRKAAKLVDGQGTVRFVQEIDEFIWMAETGVVS